MLHETKESAMKELTRRISKMTRRAAQITYYQQGESWHADVKLGYEHVGMFAHAEFDRNGYDVHFV